jgi:hypothetical protein
LSLYGSFLTFSGLTLAAAALFAQTPIETTKHISSVVIFLSMISALFVFVQYHWLNRLYDALGFSKAHFQCEEDINKFYARRTEYSDQFKRRKPVRRCMDISLYVIAIAQIVLLGIASCLI